MAHEAKSIDSDVKNITNELQGTSITDASALRNLEALLQLTRNKQVAKNLMKTKEVYTMVIDTMEAHYRHQHLLITGFACLRNLAPDESTAEELAASRAVEVARKAMKLNPFNERIVRMINEFLIAATKTARAADLFASHLTLGPVMFSLSKHFEHETIVSNMNMLDALAKHSCYAFATETMLHTMIHLLSGNHTRGYIAASIAQTLFSYSANAALGLRLFETQLVDKVLKMCVSFRDNDKLIEMAVRMLLRLVSHHAHLLEALRKLNVVDVLIPCLDAYYDHDVIGTLIPLFVETFCKDADLDVARGWVVKANQDAGLPVASKDKGLTPSAPLVDAKTVLTLQKIAICSYMDHYVNYSIDSGFVPQIVKCLKLGLDERNDFSAALIESGTRCVMRLAVDDSIIHAIMQENGVIHLIKVMDAYAQTPKILYAAFLALARMCSREHNAMYVFKSGGSELALVLLNNHPDDEDIARAVVHLVAKFTNFPVSRTLCAETGMTAHMVHVLREFGGRNAKFSHMCMVVLAGLVSVEGMAGRLFDMGGAETLSMCVHDHLKEYLVMKDFLILVEKLCATPANIPALKKRHMFESIMNVMEMHSNEEALCKKLLLTLGAADEIPAAHALVQTGVKADFHKQSSSDAKSATEEFAAQVSFLGNLGLLAEHCDKLHAIHAEQTLLAAFNAVINLPHTAIREKIVNHAVAGLLHMGSHHEAVLKWIISSGTLNQLVQTTKAHPDYRDLARHTTSIICVAFGAPPTVSNTVLNNRALMQDLIAIGHANSLNGDVLLNITSCLLMRSTSALAATTICVAGGSEVVVDSTRANLRPRSAVLASLKAMSQLAVWKNDNIAESLCKAGAVGAIVDVMRLYLADAEVVQCAATALSELLHREADVVLATAKGVVPILVTAIRQHPANTAVLTPLVVTMELVARFKEGCKAALSERYGTVALVTWAKTKHAGSVAAIGEAVDKQLAAFEVFKREEAAQQPKAPPELPYSPQNVTEVLEKIKANASDASTVTSCLEALMAVHTAGGSPARILQRHSLVGLVEILKLFATATPPNEALYKLTLKCVGMVAGALKEDPNRPATLIGSDGASQGTLILAEPKRYSDSAGGPGPGYTLARASTFGGSAGELKTDDAAAAAATNAAQAHSGVDEQALAEAVALVIKSQPVMKVDLGLITRLFQLGALIKTFTPVSVTVLSEAGTSEYCMQILKTHVGTDLLSPAVHLLVAMCGNTQFLQTIATADNVKHLFTSLTQNANAYYQKSGIGLLARFGQRDELKTLIGDTSKGIAYLVSTIKGAERTPEGDHVVDSCMQALAALTANHAANVALLMKADGLKLTTGLLESHVAVSGVVEAGTRVLTNLGTAHKDAVVGAGAVNLVIKCLLAHYDDVVVLRAALANLLALEDHAGAVAQILKLGGVQAVVAGMTEHGQSADVDTLTTGVKVMAALIPEHVLEENMLTMAQQGAVQAVIQVASRFTKNEDVVTAAMRCLFLLMKSPTTTRVAVRNKAAEFLVEVMHDEEKKPVSEQKPQLIGKCVLLAKSLATCSADVDFLVDGLLTACLVRAGKDFVRSNSILATVLSALTMLAVNADVATKMGIEGAVDFMLALFRHFVSDAANLPACMQVLTALSLSEANAIHMADHQVLIFFRQALGGHPTDVRIINHCFSLLANMGLHEAAIARVPQSDAVLQTLTTLKLHITEPQILMRGVQALRNMTYCTEEVRKHMEERGVVQEMERIMHVHASRTDVVKLCQNVIVGVMKGRERHKDTPKEIFQRKLAETSDAEEINATRRTFLVHGSVLTKHTKTSLPKLKHLSVSPDLKTIVWRDPEDAQHSRLEKVANLRGIDRGRKTLELQKRRFGKCYLNEDLLFALDFRSRKPISFECTDPVEREKWVDAIHGLIRNRNLLLKSARSQSVH